LIMYNFCVRIAMAVVIMQSQANVYIYKVDFSMAVEICRSFFRIHGKEPPPGEPETLIKKYTVPVRPGRTDERKSKTK